MNSSSTSFHSNAQPNPQLPKPPLKWVGGKGQLLPKLLSNLPKTFSTYHEPFIGGGAVFFAFVREIHLDFKLTAKRRSKDVFLSDANEELIQLYKTIRDDVDGLIRDLKEYVYDEETYYAVRAYEPKTLTETQRASRFLYLNRTCFNGVYRVNKQGRFNVPFGKYQNPMICDEENLRACSKALKGVVLASCGFEAGCAPVSNRSLVYFDPPYVPVSKSADFTGYTKDGFSSQDQERLARLFRNLSERGAYCMLSNADVPVVRELYKGFSIESVQAKRHINSKAEKRGPVGEVIVRSWVKP